MIIASGKSKASKRTLRVATIFTGAAFATVGLAQAANAAPSVAPNAKPTSKHIGRPIRPDYRYDGSIVSSQECTTATSHQNDPGAYGTWLHVSTTHNSGEGLFDVSNCFAKKGIMFSPWGTGIHAECGGNNRGYIDGTNKGKYVSIAFGVGTTYRAVNWSHYSAVLINSWTGNDKCPKVPNYGL